ARGNRGPFVKSIDRHQASSPTIRLAERSLTVNALDARVDGPGPDRGIDRPEVDQAPLGRDQLAPGLVLSHSQDEVEIGGRDVEAGPIELGHFGARLDAEPLYELGVVGVSHGEASA